LVRNKEMDLAKVVILEGDFLANRQKVLKANYGMIIQKRDILRQMIVDEMCKLSNAEYCLKNLDFAINREYSTINFKIENGIRYSLNVSGFGDIDCRDALNEQARMKNIIHESKLRLFNLKYVEENYDLYEELCRHIKRD